MCIPACMYVAYFSTFHNLVMHTVSIHQLIGRMVEIYTQMYIHLCKHKNHIHLIIVIVLYLDCMLSYLVLMGQI